MLALRAVVRRRSASRRRRRWRCPRAGPRTRAGQSSASPCPRPLLALGVLLLRVAGGGPHALAAARYVGTPVLAAAAGARSAGAASRGSGRRRARALARRVARARARRGRPPASLLIARACLALAAAVALVAPAWSIRARARRGRGGRRRPRLGNAAGRAGFDGAPPRFPAVAGRASAAAAAARDVRLGDDGLARPLRPGAARRRRAGRGCAPPVSTGIAAGAWGLLLAVTSRVRRRSRFSPDCSRRGTRLPTPCAPPSSPTSTSNLPALEAVLAAIDAEAPDELWCLGDIVGYGPRPSECCALVAARAHDLPRRQSRPRRPRDDRPATSSAATPRSRRLDREVLTPEAGAYLDSLAPEGERAGVALYHGSARDPVWEYVLSDEARAATLALTEAAARARRPQPRRPAGLAVATGTARAGSRRPGTGARPRRGAPRCSTPARSASRGTATRAPRGCCSISQPDTRASAGSSTTSRARRPRCAPPACPSRSRPGSASASSRPSRPSSRLGRPAQGATPRCWAAPADPGRD